MQHGENPAPGAMVARRGTRCRAGPRPPAATRRGVPLVVACALLWLAVGMGACNSLFFQPNRIGYASPPQFGLGYEEVYFRSGDGTQLTAWYLPARGTPRGTIIHFHGNGANISNHLVLVHWLPAQGYSVFTFDYRGYGVSDGEPDRAGVIADGVAAIEYIRGRADVDPQRLILFGQSLGGAVAISALARTGTEGVRVLVVEGSFASYREVARLIMNNFWLTWPLQYPAAYLLFSDDLRPLDDLPRIADVPLLVIHSEVDRTVPFPNGEHLFGAFPGEDKTFWRVPRLPHGATFARDGSPWRPRLLRYLEEKVGR